MKNSQRKPPSKAKKDKPIPLVGLKSKFVFQGIPSPGGENPYPPLDELADKCRAEFDYWSTKHQEKVRLLSAKRLELLAAARADAVTARSIGEKIEQLDEEQKKCASAANIYQSHLNQVVSQINARGKNADGLPPQYTRELLDRLGARKELLQKVQTQEAIEWRMVCALAQEDSSFLYAIEDKSNQFLGPVAYLAQQGNPEAIRALAEISLRLVGVLDQVADQYPAAVKLVAEHETRWPVNFSIPRYGPKRVVKKLTERMKRIGLAEQTLLGQSLQLPAISSRAAQLAWELVEHLQKQRTKVKSQKALRITPRQNKSRQIKWIRYKFDELQEEAAALPEFSPGTFNDWWNLARRFLARDYPNYPNRPEFAFVLAPSGGRTVRAATSGRKPTDPKRAFDKCMSDHFRTFSGKDQARSKATRSKKAMTP